MGSLRHNRKHDVHDNHAADHHKHADDAHRRSLNGSGELIPQLGNRIIRQEREIVILAGVQMPERTDISTTTVA